MTVELRLTTRPVNIFVIGDLVIDHAIFVVHKTRPYHAVHEEKVYDVRHRLNTAGGAANAARALGALSYGTTYLWGLTGRSLWGAFADILDASEVADVTTSKVILVGHHDDAARMNTVTRVILADTSPHTHQARFDDIRRVGPSRSASESLIDQLEKVHKATYLNAIIISDLDMNALDAGLIGQISAFAADAKVPLFVDPKRNFAKYEHTQATAIMPNLYEWCELIGESNKEAQWRSEIKTPDGLARFAQKSLRRFTTFQYHIIKCDKDGAVVIGPAKDKRHSFVAIHLPPHPGDATATSVHQLGSGDVLTAVTTMEFVGGDATHPTDKIVRGVRLASWVVAAYRQMPWGQMASREHVRQLKTGLPEALEEIEISAATRYMPADDLIDLTTAKTDVPPLLSVDAKYKSELRRLLERVEKHWDGDLRSVILTARGGSGKSEICRQLHSLLEPIGIQVLEATETLLKGGTYQDLLRKVNLKRPRTAAPSLLLIIDEAFSKAEHLLKGKKGVLLLELFSQHHIRLLMIDADFAAVRNDLSESQFLTRCDIVELPALDERPHDIAYIYLAGCANAATKVGVQQFECERRTIASVIEVALHGSAVDQSPRTIFKLGRESFEASTAAGAGDMVVKPEHVGREHVIAAGTSNGGSVRVRWT